MLEVMLKILDSNVMFYVVIPVILVVLSWIKQAYDDNKRKKEYGIWIKKYERVKTFVVIMLQQYKILAFIFIVALFIFLFLELLYSRICGYIGLGIFYFGGSILWVIYLLNSRWLKVEMLDKKKEKKRMIIFLYFIYTISLLLATVDALFEISYVVFIVLHIVWACILLKEYDLAFKIDNQYVDIYTKECDVTECVEVKTIRKKNGWITGEQYKNGEIHNIQIEESEIKKVDYHGEPVVIVERIRPFKKNIEFTRMYHDVFYTISK